MQGGKPAYITWRRNGIVPGSIFLQYSTDRGATWQYINTTPIIGAFQYGWLVPRINSNKCLVRMIYSITKAEFDRSNAPFTITTSASATNFPNPFNPSTKIVFGLENKAKVSLRVYNSLGQQVAELVSSQLEPGEHGYEFNATNLPSGVYLYDLNIDGKSQVSKMILVK